MSTPKTKAINLIPHNINKYSDNLFIKQLFLITIIIIMISIKKYINKILYEILDVGKKIIRNILNETSLKYKERKNNRRNIKTNLWQLLKKYLNKFLRLINTK